MRVLILGGYGLIGSAITKHLAFKGYHVTGLGRSARKGEALLPCVKWMGADIAALTQAQDWHRYLENIDVVINAAGVLQNGLFDKVAAVQSDAITALIKACEQTGTHRFIQISAPGASLDSTTLFYKTKAMADDALKTSELSWTIFRPGLVIAPYAYGGTRLIRTLAAFPLVQPVVMGTTQIQTVFVDDVAKAVSFAIDSNIIGVDVDLVEDELHMLRDITLGFRRWLGFARPKAILELPLWTGKLVGRLADVAGFLGWRSALRTTALEVLSRGVTGNPAPWKKYSGAPHRSLAQSFEALPSTLQERVFAKAMLLFPMLILTLAGFWTASGVIGFAQQDGAIAKLGGALPYVLARTFVWLGSLADILIGIALLFRPTARLACLASIVLSAAYLGASAWLTPYLWADPLGPMVKVFPIIALAAITAALTQER